VEQLYAPPDDPVFELVPATFAHYTQKIYDNMGSPAVTGETIWDIYRGLVQRLEELDSEATTTDYADYLDCIDQWEVNENLMDGADAEPPYPLIDGQDLRGGYENPHEDGSVYLGGVNGGDGLGMFLLTMPSRCDSGTETWSTDDDLVRRLNQLDDNDEEFELEIAAEFSDEEAPDPNDVDEW
jgi:hypothetical protein